MWRSLYISREVRGAPTPSDCVRFVPGSVFEALATSPSYEDGGNSIVVHRKSLEDGSTLGSVVLAHDPPLGRVHDIQLCAGNLFVQAYRDFAATRSWTMFDLLNVRRSDERRFELSQSASACSRKRKML